MSVKKEEIAIVGGSNVGIAAATRLRRIREDVNITIFDKSEHIGYPASGIPYFLSNSLKSADTFTKGFEERLTEIYNINIVKECEVQSINRDTKTITVFNLRNKQVYEKAYDKLVLATGFYFSLSDKELLDSPNFFIIKNIEQAIRAKDYIRNRGVKKISIVGVNTISINIAVSMIEAGYEVALITKEKNLIENFDNEFDYILKNELTKAGIRVYCGIESIVYKKNTENSVTNIEINYLDIETQLVIYCDDPTPSSYLAANSGLNVGKKRAVLVDSFFQTSDPDIYSGGGVAEFLNAPLELGGRIPGINRAMNHGRDIGSNIGGVKTAEQIFVDNVFFKIKNFNIGMVGISEAEAEANSLETYSITVFSGDRERFVPEASQIHIKLIVDKNSQAILGAFIRGKSNEVSRKLDVLITSIHSGLTVSELSALNFTYHPSNSTIKDTLNIAGMIACDYSDGLTNLASLENSESEGDIFILDVRNKKERDKSMVLNSKWIPLAELRSRLNELPKDKNIYIYGNVGLRGYVAERILKNNDFKNTFNISGGIASIKINENIDNNY